MDGPKLTVVAIVLLLVGLLAGYLFWGQRQRQLAGELTATKARLAEAQASSGREAELNRRLQEAQVQLTQLTEQLTQAREARQKLEALVAKGRK